MADKLTKSFTLSDWQNLRLKLKDKSLLTTEWDETIKILKERVTERYFEPIQILINNSKDKGEGFTILTVECALIEFLATLKDGRIYKRGKASTDQCYYYSMSAKIYGNFLKSAPIFENYFFHKDKTSPRFNRHDFYVNVRCALIHEAQTKNNWEIRIFKNKRADLQNTIIFDIDRKGKKVIYRSALNTKLNDYFVHFCDIELKQQTQVGRTLRKFLARKIDHIAEIQPDKSFWWE